MINVAGRLINPAHISSAEIDTRHYMNGSASTLIVRLIGGKEFRVEHGHGFDAFEMLKTIEAAT